MSIVAGVVPEIIRVVLGRALGFSVGGLGSYGQYVDDLRKFFYDEIWRGQRIEELEPL